MSGPPAKLALEDGTVFTGHGFGATGETFGEVVFNTSMTGYQEVLTDPSYAGQIVTMTAPQIGNYGVASGDAESQVPRVAGFVMREASPLASNWRADGTLRDYLVRRDLLVIPNRAVGRTGGRGSRKRQQQKQRDDPQFLRAVYFIHDLPRHVNKG